MQKQMEKESIIEIDMEEKLPQSCCDGICELSKRANDGSESESRSKSSKKLRWLIIFCLITIAAEVVGGLMANSLAILTDAAHMLTDVIGISISIFAVWASGWKATPRHSFGFFRFEVLGALLSVQLIWLMAVILIYEAVERMVNGGALVNGKLTFLTAAFGVFINLMMFTLLGHDHHSHHHHSHSHNGHCSHESEEVEEAEEISLVTSHAHESHQCEIHIQSQSIIQWILSSMKQLKQTHINMNVQGAYLHVLGDLIQSVGVMIGGAVMWAKPNWLVVDVVCTLGFSVLTLLTTITMIRDIFLILMESTPAGVDIDEIETGLGNIRGVQAVHDLHVWAISAGKLLLSCHVIAEQGTLSNEIIKQTEDYCRKAYGIHHVTLQIE